MKTQTQKQTLFITTISHRHGTNVYANTTEAGAYNTIDQYVQEWWIEDKHNNPLPPEMFDRIQQYFETADDEYYNIDPVEVEP